jgi:uncharacterized protein YbjT (DUF2867 family)
MNFFNTATGNLLRFERAAGVQHHVALSVVGTDRLAQNRPSDGERAIRGYFRAKLLQEKLIKESSIPFSIVQATQFFEFVLKIADACSEGNSVRLAPALMQPMAAEDVASGVARVAVGRPVEGIIEIGGPDQFHLDEFVRQGLNAYGDQRAVIADPAAGYFGMEVDERTLVPAEGALLGEIHFRDWLMKSARAMTAVEPQLVRKGR